MKEMAKGEGHENSSDATEFQGLSNYPPDRLYQPGVFSDYLFQRYIRQACDIDQFVLVQAVPLFRRTESEYVRECLVEQGTFLHGSDLIPHESSDRTSAYELEDGIYWVKLNTIRRRQDGRGESIEAFAVEGGPDLQKRLYKLQDLMNELIREYDQGLPSWDDLILEEDKKERIRSDIELFMNSGEYYREELGVPWKRGIILHGKPGNGKSMLIKTLRSEYQFSNKYDLRDHVCQGRIEIPSDSRGCEHPALVWIEDIDKFFPSGSAEDTDVVACSRNELLNFLDGPEALDGTLVIATTNTKELDDTLLRPGRFDNFFTFENPDADRVMKYFRYNDFLIEDEETTRSIAEELGGDKPMAWAMRLVVDCKVKERSNVVDYETARQRLDHAHTDVKDSGVDHLL